MSLWAPPCWSTAAHALRSGRARTDTHVRCRVLTSGTLGSRPTSTCLVWIAPTSLPERRARVCALVSKRASTSSRSRSCARARHRLAPRVSTARSKARIIAKIEDRKRRAQPARIVKATDAVCRPRDLGIESEYHTLALVHTRSWILVA